MSKNEVLALLHSCEKKANKILERKDLTNKQRKDIEQIRATVVYYEVYVNMHVSEKDTALLQQYAIQFKGLHENLKQLEVPRSIMERPEGDKVKVKKVIPENEQSYKATTERNKAWEIIKNILAILGVVAIIAMLCVSLKSCNIKDKDQLEDKPGYEQSIDEHTRPIDDIDIENYDELLSYAELLQGKLKNNEDISIEDIMYAIRLTNFDQLQDKNVFTDRDEVYESTKIAGKVASELGTNHLVKRDENTDIYLSEVELNDIIMCVTDNAININEFKDAKTDKGYDIYSVVDRCVKGINADNGKDLYFAKVFNDILARKAVAFTITEDSPISTYYTLLGMYNANSKRILELTSGIGLTSVYGDETRIDGYYGFICVEELEAYLHVGNENNLLYTDVIDQNITNYGLSQSR